jgi:N-acetylglucosamine kinase
LLIILRQQPLSRAEIAAVAAVVARLAAQGDPLAAQLSAAVAADLAALTLHSARSLFAPAERFDVVVAGGLTNAGDLVLGPVRQRIAHEFPRAAFTVGAEAPAVALGRLAQVTVQSGNAKP